MATPPFLWSGSKCGLHRLARRRDHSADHLSHFASETAGLKIARLILEFLNFRSLRTPASSWLAEVFAGLRAGSLYILEKGIFTIKKSFLILSAIICTGVSAYAQDLSAPAAPTNHLQKAAATRQQQPVETTPQRVDGALPNAARKGNVLQAINPFAPKRYGSGKRYVYPSNPKPEQTVKAHANSEVHKGLILFAFSW